MNPDYGPTGCCRPLTAGVLAAFTVIGWGFAYLAYHVVRWLA